jgi:hypothetical protein
MHTVQKVLHRFSGNASTYNVLVLNPNAGFDAGAKPGAAVGFPNEKDILDIVPSKSHLKLTNNQVISKYFS